MEPEKLREDRFPAGKAISSFRRGSNDTIFYFKTGIRNGTNYAAVSDQFNFGEL